MFKTTIFLHRIGKKLYSRECDIISQFTVINEPEEGHISRIIELDLGLQMKKVENENSFISQDGNIEVRYHNQKL
jgi:hypothetical protein